MRLEINTYKHKHEQAIILQENSFLPGQSGIVKLKAGKLPSGSLMTFIAHVFRSNNEGPTLLILGGVHGDEINGIEIITSLLEKNVFSKINRGTAIVIPMLNVFGFNNSSRDLPDGKDVNRSFPGSTGGSLASRIARTLTKYILPYVDFALDLHTGGAERYNFPQTRFNKADTMSKVMAEIFGAPFQIQQPLISHSFRKIAKEMGCHSIVYEGGESIRINQTAINHGIDGCMRILKALDFLPDDIEVKPEPPGILIEKTSWIRAAHAGIFIWEKKSGERIKVGDRLGEIKDPYGIASEVVTSKLSGYIIGHNNAAVVHQGDPLFHVGLVSDETGF